MLIPNGTEIEVADAGGEQGSATLATIGRLERYKGHHRVLAAFPGVLERRPEARLLIVGEGPYEQELRRQAEELGVAERVEFTSVPPGDPAAMGALLGRVALVVLLSDFETHPLVALEAAAARRRLLVADNGGLGELAEDGFATAIPVDDPPELDRRRDPAGARPAAAEDAPGSPRGTSARPPCSSSTAQLCERTKVQADPIALKFFFGQSMSAARCPSSTANVCSRFSAWHSPSRSLPAPKRRARRSGSPVPKSRVSRSRRPRLPIIVRRWRSPPRRPATVRRSRARSPGRSRSAGETPSRVDFAIDGTKKWSQASAPYLYGGVSGEPRHHQALQRRPHPDRHRLRLARG